MNFKFSRRRSERKLVCTKTKYNRNSLKNCLDLAGIHMPSIVKKAYFFSFSRWSQWSMGGGGGLVQVGGQSSVSG